MDEIEEELAQKNRIYVKVLAATFIAGILVAAAILPFTDAETRGMTSGIFVTEVGAVLTGWLILSLRFLSQKIRFSLLIGTNMVSTTIAIGLGGSQVYPLAGLYALGVMVECPIRDKRRVILTAAASWILFSLAVLVRYGGHFGSGTYPPVFFMAFVMALAVILGSLSSQAERNLRARLTATVSNLRTVQEAQEKQLQKLTETHMLLEERYAETYALYLIEQEIAAELEVDKILPKVADIVLGLLGGRSCSIMLADLAQACLRQAAVSGACQGDLVFPLSGNLLARSWAENVPLSLADLSAEDRAFWTKRGANGLLCLPIGTKSERVGLILVEYDHLPQSLDDHRDLLSLVAGQLSLALENAYLYRKVRLMATHDALTGLANRYYFQERLTAELETASAAHPLAVILLDVDHFKTVNDEFGHQIGDGVLRFLAVLLVEEAGQEGTVARYGGEEFVVLLAGSALERAVQIAERIRAKVAATTCRCSERRIKITVSLGVATYPGQAKDRRSLLRLADQALYLAKQERNKMVVAEPQPPPPTT